MLSTAQHKADITHRQRHRFRCLDAWPGCHVTGAEAARLGQVVRRQTWAIRGPLEPRGCHASPPRWWTMAERLRRWSPQACWPHVATLLLGPRRSHRCQKYGHCCCDAMSRWQVPARRHPRRPRRCRTASRTPPPRAVAAGQERTGNASSAASPNGASFPPTDCGCHAWAWQRGP